MSRLQFIIVSLPRSGSTWAANLLSTDGLLVEHDPLYHTHYTEWEHDFDAVACTGIWRAWEWLNAQPVPKLVLHRPLHEVEASLKALGVHPLVTKESVRMLSLIEGHHMQWTDLFKYDRAQDAAEFVCPGHLIDRARHATLCKINMQPQWSNVNIDADLQRRLATEWGI